jgi:hypothetical protein
LGRRGQGGKKEGRDEERAVDFHTCVNRQLFGKGQAVQMVKRPMASPFRTVCLACGAVNRIGRDRPAVEALCGACRARLFTGKPADKVAC